ncbi:hypothetical protein [Streptomyces sp. NPDC093094]|uniref:hypothetical protein n=1 Tax=Streptomyces sp. NPDC093094 TaxID=3366026 RepID=UPI003802B43B
MTATVVMALTGFSAGHKNRDGGDGGGCSSSSQDHDGSSTSTTGGGSSGSGSGSSGSTQKPAQDTPVIVVSCASAGDPYATVKVQNPNDRKVTFTAYVTFLTRQGVPLTERSTQITAPAHGEGTGQIAVGDDALAAQVFRCQALRQAEAMN